MRYAVLSDGLEEAVRLASKATGTLNIIAFDGAVGGFNLTEPLADLLRSKAPGIEEKGGHPASPEMVPAEKPKIG